MPDEADEGTEEKHGGTLAESLEERIANYKPKYTPGSALLGLATQRRRETLGVTQEEVAEQFGGPSVASLRTIENAQADNYRAKTLFSLDAALSWPKGTSMSLLTGNFDRLDSDWRKEYQRDFGVDMFDPFGLTHLQLDQLVNYLIDTLSDSDYAKYNVPVHAPGRALRNPLTATEPENQAQTITVGTNVFPTDKVNVTVQQVLTTLSFDEVRRLNDILSKITLVASRPQILTQLRDAETEMQAVRMDAAFATAEEVRAEDQLQQDPSNEDFRAQVHQARQRRMVISERENYSLRRYYDLQKKLEDIDSFRISMPEEFSISVQSDAEVSKDGERGEATE